MRRGWHERRRENGWLNRRKGPVANRDLWERLLEATRRHREVWWRKVKGHQKTGGAHKAGNDRATSSPWPQKGRPSLSHQELEVRGC